jgi:arylsulfatase A-like enzyme
MVSLIDHHVGRVMDALDELDISDNTVVVFLSDHGDMMGDHGLLNKGPFHFEGLLRVPMIWRWPGRFRPAASPALVSLLDVPPTILELAGVAIPEGFTSPEAPQQPPAWPGRSLAGLLAGQADAVQDSVVIENDEDYLGLRLRTLVTQTHKITTYTGHRGPEPYGELFDLADDPHELHNLWDSPAHAALRRQLIEQLHHRLTETDIALPRRLGHA